MRTTTYYAFHSNGVFVQNDNLIDISQLPNVEYLVKEESEVNVTPKYAIIHSSGLLRFLRFGVYELRDIGTIIHTSSIKRTTVTLTICDIKSEEIFQETIDCKYGVTVIRDYIIPFMKSLTGTTITNS